MPYTTVLIPDESMPIYSEKTLDDKFKPEVIVHKKGKEIIMEGELKDGRLKIITSENVHNVHLGAIEIPVLIYAKANVVKAVQKREETYSFVMSNISAVRGSSEDISKFYECKVCGGYIEGGPEEKPEGLREKFLDDVAYNCQRCGTILAKRSIVL